MPRAALAAAPQRMNCPLSVRTPTSSAHTMIHTPDAQPRMRVPFTRSRLAAWCLGTMLLGHAAAAHSEWLVPGDHLRVTFGPKVIHFDPSPEHAAHNNLVSAELLTKRWTFWGADRSIIGFAMFDNSFGQFSQYLSFGQEWDLWPLAGGQIFGNVTAGLIHGYKEPYEDKIPFNKYGVAPGILPTLGWRRGHFSLTATLLGFNGLLVGAGWSFDLK